MESNWIQDLRDKRIPGSAITTLIINGNPYFSGLLEDFLKQAGHNVHKAATAEQGVTSTREIKPDVVLVHNELDDAAALTLIPEILLEHPNAEVILLASKPSVQEAVQAIKLGASHYLEGPLEPKKLIDLAKPFQGFPD